MKYYATLLLSLCYFTSFTQTAPNFTVTNSAGQTKNLYTDYLNQGKVVVLEAFFTTCPPCNTHAPYWQALYQSELATYPNKVEFIMLSTLQSDNNAKVAQYKANKSLSMPGVGSDGGSLTALQPYQSGQFGDFLGTPTYILIQPGGEVIFDIRGISEQGTMDLIGQHIAAALSQDCVIESNFGTPIPNVQISATTANMTLNITASGTYSLSGLPPLQNASYTVSAAKTDGDPSSGISTFDLVQISRHIIGLAPFTEPWQVLAADMNCSGLVTTFDIVVGRQLILGLLNELPCGPWKFIAQGSTALSNGACVDFQGVKLGDVTGPYFAPLPSDRSSLSLVASDRQLQAGQRFTLELTSKELLDIQAFQLDFEFDPDALTIQQVTSDELSGFDATCFRLSATGEGHLPLLWINGASARLYPEIPILKVEGTARRAGRLSDLLHLRSGGLPAEIYDAELLPRQMDLEWQSDVPKTKTTLFPNPARDAFQMYFNSPETGTVLLQVVDLQGKTVWEKTLPTSKGDNWMDVQTGDIVPGLHLLKANGQSMGKILLGM